MSKERVEENEGDDGEFDEKKDGDDDDMGGLWMNACPSAAAQARAQVFGIPPGRNGRRWRFQDGGDFQFASRETMDASGHSQGPVAGRLGSGASAHRPQKPPRQPSKPPQQRGPSSGSSGEPPRDGGACGSSGVRGR